MAGTRYRDVFVALDAADVRYVVVGGLAVVLQGHPRMTVDLDVVVDLADGPAVRAMTALASLGLLPRLPVPAASFADPDVGSREPGVGGGHLRGGRAGAGQ